MQPWTTGVQHSKVRCSAMDIIEKKYCDISGTTVSHYIVFPTWMEQVFFILQIHYLCKKIDKNEMEKVSEN